MLDFYFSDHNIIILQSFIYFWVKLIKMGLPGLSFPAGSGLIRSEATYVRTGDLLDFKDHRLRQRDVIAARLQAHRNQKSGIFYKLSSSYILKCSIIINSGGVSFRGKNSIRSTFR